MDSTFEKAAHAGGELLEAKCLNPHEKTTALFNQDNLRYIVREIFRLLLGNPELLENNRLKLVHSCGQKKAGIRYEAIQCFFLIR